MEAIYTCYNFSQNDLLSWFENNCILIIVYLGWEWKEIGTLVSIYVTFFDKLKKIIYPINYRVFNNIIGMNYLKIKLLTKQVCDLQGW